MSEKYGYSDSDLGNGFSFRFIREHGVEGHTGIIISGPSAPDCVYKKGESGGEAGMCGGGLFFENSKHAQKEGRPMWKVESLNPLTLSPSIQCKCRGQHGHIVEGKYIPC